jgi:hypothetical protein
MTQSIDQALVIEFSDQVIALAQQMNHRTKGTVRERTVSGNEFAVERLAEVRDIEITTRHAPTVAQDITHSRRQLKMRDFRVTLLLDEPDQLQTLIDPQAAYSRHMAMAMNVRKDKLVMSAAFADVKTGRNFGTTVTFANDDGSTVTTGSVNLTYDKLLSVQQNFINNDVGTDMEEKLYIAITGSQNTALMKEEELTSGDFNRRNDFIREKGRITEAAGFQLLHFSGTNNDSIIAKASTTRDCVAYSSEGIMLGINKDMTLKVNERPDVNNALQLQATMYLNAVRVDGRRVQKVQCTEA